MERQRPLRISGRGWLVRRMLLAADLIGLIAAFIVAEVAFGHFATGQVDWPRDAVLFSFGLPLWVVVAKLNGLYDRDTQRLDHSTADEVPALLHVVTLGAWGVFVGARLSGIADPDLIKVGTFWAAAIVMISVARAGARTYCRRQSSYLQNVVIVGMNEAGLLLVRQLTRHPEYGLNLIGCVDIPTATGLPPDSIPSLGTSDELPAMVPGLNIARVVIASSGGAEDRVADLVRTLGDLGTSVYLIPSHFQLVGRGVTLQSVEGLPLLALPASSLPRSSLLLKRTMDILLAGLGVTLCLPLLTIIAPAIKLDSRGPIFFRQTRMGAKGRTFRIWKLRTMVIDAESRKHEFVHLNHHARETGVARMFKIPNDPRITRVGRVLRACFLDELPQLLNVLVGDMSLVGPRPLILEEDEHVQGWARRRLDLKPGMTGLWQISGHSGISFEEMVQLDYLYVTNWSLLEDIRLVLRTLPVLFGGGRRGR